jgi:hypothetical protein
MNSGKVLDHIAKDFGIPALLLEIRPISRALSETTVPQSIQILTPHLL